MKTLIKAAVIAFYLLLGVFVMTISVVSHVPVVGVILLLGLAVACACFVDLVK